MTGLGYQLRIELDHLVSMIPRWEIHAQLCYDKLMGTGDANDLLTYSEVYWKAIYMRERMEWITNLLEDNPGE